MLEVFFFTFVIFTYVSYHIRGSTHIIFTKIYNMNPDKRSSTVCKLASPFWVKWFSANTAGPSADLLLTNLQIFIKAESQMLQCSSKEIGGIENMRRQPVGLASKHYSKQYFFLNKLQFFLFIYEHAIYFRSTVLLNKIHWQTKISFSCNCKYVSRDSNLQISNFG